MNNQTKPENKPLTIGIIGGGQLGMMSAQAAQKLGFKTVIFSDQDESPANHVADDVIIADYEDAISIKKFADLIDVATFEFENIPVKTIENLAKLKPVFPKAEVLKITQNRIFEKTFLNKIGVKTASFAEIKSLEDLENNLEKFGKAVLKTATMGYDGKGQMVLKNLDDAKNAWQKFSSSLNQQLILEEFCPFLSEISVICARTKNGEIACYEPLTNIHKNAILDQSIYPAKISDNTKNAAQKIATKIANELYLTGLIAVEFFVMQGEELLVNELAPRPHNSGHFSMDASNTSQFEQLIRAVTDMPLGNVDFHSKGYMKNLIGDEVNHLEEFHANKNAKIHLYGKKEAKPGRKMGHVNIIEK